jgi:hypothetical protein
MSSHPSRAEIPRGKYVPRGLREAGDDTQPRPREVSDEEFARNWDRIFGNKEKSDGHPTS